MSSAREISEDTLRCSYKDCWKNHIFSYNPIQTFLNLCEILVHLALTMRFITVLSATFAGMQTVQAHSKLNLALSCRTLTWSLCQDGWVRLGINGEWKQPLAYIRPKADRFIERATPGTTDNLRYWNTPSWAGYDYDESIRCGRNNNMTAADTDVLEVKAGDEIEFVPMTNGPEFYESMGVQWDNCPDGRGICRKNGEAVVSLTPHDFHPFF
jgi:hypothetical protein